MVAWKLGVNKLFLGTKWEGKRAPSWKVCGGEVQIHQGMGTRKEGENMPHCRWIPSILAAELTGRIPNFG
ncbi:hypothetical protein Y1Q_0010658 [Alligator mississippiensis]|uniref:Uncharacterized protein n=1 Tax=Alligator mississippiensis TaxID=8496 RepID=A0A151M6D6_ALLMI|nr:hypothetical protein Y1Q_0010658 [Alligator mississippiensis]